MEIKNKVLGLFLAMSTMAAFSHNNVVVVPLGVGEGELVTLENIVTVAQADGDFTNIQDAIDSISNANASNPYLIVIGPGTYPISTTVATKDHVHITGSGIGITILDGTVSGSLALGAVISASSNVSISNLSIENTSSAGTNTIGITIKNSLVTISNVLIDNVSIFVSGAPSNSCRGIYVEAGDNIVIQSSNITIEGTTYNYGIRTFDGHTVINGVSIDVANGTRNRGIYGSSTNNTNLIENSKIVADGVLSYAILGGDNEIRNTSITGNTGSISVDVESSGSFFWSTLDGASTGSLSCVYSADSNGNLLDSSCSQIP